MLGRKIAVSDASPVVRLADGRLEIPSGEVAGTFGRKGMGFAAFEITGTGKLALYVGDGLVGEFVRGDTGANFGEIEAGTSFRVVYTPGEEDGGCAFLDALGAKTGVILIVR